MRKVKHLASICFCCILLLSCETKKSNTSSGKTDVDTIALDVPQLEKNKEQLSSLDYKLAVKSYGEPEENEFIKLNKESVQFEWGIGIKKHFPNKAYETVAIPILEASWQLQNQSWITVWYKMENEVWKPFEVLVTI